jgi:hypothetical protein
MKLRYKLRSQWEEIKLYLRLTSKQVGAPWLGHIAPVGRLYATKISPDGAKEDLGLVSTRKVTTAFANYLVDGLQANTTDVALFRFHDSGTGNTAEANSQTALVTPTGISRVSGTQTEGASANIYRTVATIAYNSTFAVVEHGIFSASSAGTLMDRSVFAAINVLNGDSIQFTYELTVSAEA